jgi:hypothetical protein
VRLWLIVFAVLNAALYSALLPLWEGFDEPFHFAFVQQLANGWGLLDPHQAPLTREVDESFRLAPASHVVLINLPQSLSYNAYFALPLAERLELRQRLWNLPVEWRWIRSRQANYEAHHPPLGYLLLAVPERLLARVPLLLRVLLLRWICALAGAFLLMNAARRLATQLGLSETHCDLVVFGVLSTQMTWATIAHVANDWLAVPLAIWTLVWTIEYSDRPTRRNLICAVAILALGLWTKAYFLTCIPLLLCVCAIRGGAKRALLAVALLAALAGPWYCRNWFLYGTVSGMQEARAGIGATAVLRAAPSLPWIAALGNMARGALWTSNNSFGTFSAVMLNTMLALGLAGLCLWAASAHSRAEWITAAYCACFAAALLYATGIMWLSVHGIGASPWYAETAVAPLYVLFTLGAARWRFGRVLSITFALLSGYVLIATYAVKLIPLYSGFEGRSTLAELAQWYGRDFPRMSANLGTAALAPSWCLFALAAAVIAVTLILAILLTRRLAHPAVSRPA